jgi:tRNA A58 N-methylase Trm61
MSHVFHRRPFIVTPADIEIIVERLGDAVDAAITEAKA